MRFASSQSDRTAPARSARPATLSSLKGSPPPASVLSVEIQSRCGSPVFSGCLSSQAVLSGRPMSPISSGGFSARLTNSSMGLQAPLYSAIFPMRRLNPRIPKRSRVGPVRWSFAHSTIIAPSGSRIRSRKWSGFLPGMGSTWKDAAERLRCRVDLSVRVSLSFLESSLWA